MRGNERSEGRAMKEEGSAFKEELIGATDQGVIPQSLTLHTSAREDRRWDRTDLGSRSFWGEWFWGEWSRHQRERGRPCRRDEQSCRRWGWSRGRRGRRRRHIGTGEPRIERVLTLGTRWIGYVLHTLPSSRGTGTQARIHFVITNL